MTKTLTFVIPAHGRLDLAAICYRQLVATIDDLWDIGVAAQAVVVACDENLDLARSAAFHTLERPNDELGRKFNDGIEWAASQGADFVVPCGSDDWLHPSLFADLTPDAVRCFRDCSVVSEDGLRLGALRIATDGGIGVRVLPRVVLGAVGFRPAQDKRQRAVDSSVMASLLRRFGRRLRLDYAETAALAIVDFKTYGANLNTYDACLARHRVAEFDPRAALATMYPAESVAAIGAHYARATAPEGAVA